MMAAMEPERTWMATTSAKEGIVGSPNVGKSVIFNNLTGLNDKIAP